MPFVVSRDLPFRFNHPAAMLARAVASRGPVLRPVRTADILARVALDTGGRACAAKDIFKRVSGEMLLAAAAIFARVSADAGGRRRAAARYFALMIGSLCRKVCDADRRARASCVAGARFFAAADIFARVSIEARQPGEPSPPSVPFVNAVPRSRRLLINALSAAADSSCATVSTR